MRGRRLRADHHAGDRPSLQRLGAAKFTDGDGSDELSEDRPLLGIELVELHLPRADHDGPGPAGGVARHVELHPPGDEYGCPGIRRSGQIEQKDDRAGRLAAVGDRDHAIAYGWLDKPSAFVQFGRPGGQSC